MVRGSASRRDRTRALVDSEGAGGSTTTRKRMENGAILCFGRGQNPNKSLQHGGHNGGEGKKKGRKEERGQKGRKREGRGKEGGRKG